MLRTGSGQPPPEAHSRCRVVAYIPLAVLIFGLGVYLAVIAAQPIGATADAQAGR